MDRHAKEYYHPASDEVPHGHFHAVIPLHEAPELTWKRVVEMAPGFPRGWFELAHLSPQDRVDFTRDFWLSQLPYHPDAPAFITRFFQQMDDVGIFLTQQKYGDPFRAEMVYSLAGDSGFFQANPPVTEEQLLLLRQQFSSVILPVDYVAFLGVHNGFRKYLDTGILSAEQVPQSFQVLQKLLLSHDPIVTVQGVMVDPVSLVPFYESFGMPCYQCFWAEWYPRDEMGNVYYSGITKTLSESPVEPDAWAENMSFPTFLDWLMFYLERVE